MPYKKAKKPKHSFKLVLVDPAGDSSNTKEVSRSFTFPGIPTGLVEGGGGLVAFPERSTRRSERSLI